MAAFASRFWAGLDVTHVQANSQPAVLLTRDGVAVALLAIRASAGGIDRLLWVMNPDKLAGITRDGAPG